MSYSRREVLRMAGAGSAALWLGGCGGSSNTAKPVAGDAWKQFGGTTLNFISENTAPTSAIAANLEPVHEADGDRDQDHPARARRDGAEDRARLRLGRGRLPDRLRRSVPGDRALQPGARRPQRVPAGPEPPPRRAVRRLRPELPARRLGALRRPRQALRAPLRRPDDDLDVPQGPVREARRADEAGPRLRSQARATTRPGTTSTRPPSGSRRTRTRRACPTATATWPSSTTRS